MAGLRTSVLQIPRMNSLCENFPDEEPLGKRLTNIPDSFGPLGQFLHDEVEIVGVVADSKYGTMGEVVEPSVFFPHRQSPFRRMTLVMKTSGDPLAMVNSLRHELLEHDPGLALGRIETFERVVAGSFAGQKFAMLLLSGFAVVALVLASVGTYGVISFAVQQRKVELAIRMALGAEPTNILALVMKHGAKLTGAGVGVGLFGAFAVGKITASLMFGVSVYDPTVFVSVTAILTVVALGASLVPAIRATRIHPAEVLKPE